MNSGWKIYGCLFLILCVLQIYALGKLIQLPNTIISVINVSDKKLFNAPPNREMVVDIAGNKFYYRIPSPFLEPYRIALNKITTTAKKGDLEQALAVARWVRLKLHASGEVPRLDYIGDGHYALDFLDNSKKFRGNCNSYSRLFTLGCLSVGIPARFVWLFTHSAAEIFLREEKKWVMIDPAYGFFVEIDGQTASCLDIRNYYINNYSKTRWNPIIFDSSTDDYMYRPGMNTGLRARYSRQLQIADAYFSLQPPGWRYNLQIRKAINWVDENAEPQGIWEQRLRYLTGINFFVVIALFVLFAHESVTIIRRK